MGKDEFHSLLSTFTESWYVELKLANPNRVCRIGGEKKDALKTMEEKLFAILLYLKTYPTFDVPGFLTNRERTRACRSTHFLLQVLERTLGKKFVLPARKITSVEEFFEKFPEMKDVFPDGTERPVQRLKDARNGRSSTPVRRSDSRRRLLSLPTKRSASSFSRRANQAARQTSRRQGGVDCAAAT